MSDTYVEECKICHQEADLINGVCGNCDANKDEVKFMGIHLLANINRVIVDFMRSGLIVGNNDPDKIIENISHLITEHKLEVETFLKENE